VAPRTFFRYFQAKEEVVFWSEYQPMLAGFVGMRPQNEAAVTALRQGIVNGLASFYGEERARLLGRSTNLGRPSRHIRRTTLRSALLRPQPPLLCLWRSRSGSPATAERT
jgi:hypothetical protein